MLEIGKIERAQEMIRKMASGFNPLNDEQLQKDDLLGDAGIVRCLYFVSEILEDVVKGKLSPANKSRQFVITAEQKSQIVLPEGKIGVNEFSRCVNLCIDQGESKKLTGVELNRHLKKLGILSEESNAEGKKRTILNEKSHEYGFETEIKSYNGVEYDMIMINNTGKKYLLENLENIMAVEL